jgi:hypothetical protein
MKYIKLVALLSLSTSVWAQKEVELPAFNKIEMDAPIKLKLVHGNATKATHENGLESIKFHVDKKVLTMEYSGEGFPKSEPITIYYTDINSIEMNGAGEIEMEAGSEIKGEAFSLECNGATKAKLNLVVTDAKIESNGASKITLAGSATHADIELAGASKLFAGEFKVKDMKMDVAGASYFNVFASENLEVDAAGASKGVYAGAPVNKKINVSGLSNIVDAQTGDNIKDERINHDDTTRITVGKKKLIIIEEGDDLKVEMEEGDKKAESSNKKYELKKVYAGFEIGMNQMISPKMDFNLPAKYNYLDCRVEKSWFYGLNLLEGDVQLIKNKLAISSGFGMEFQNFSFNSDQVLKANGTTIMADSGLVPLSKNKLYNYNLSVPLFIKYAPRTRKDRNNFHLAVGVIGSFKAYSHVKTVTSYMGYEEQVKSIDDYSINPFRLTATARIGYGWFRAFANYSLTPFFNQDHGNPDIRVFTAGITLIPFQD